MQFLSEKRLNSERMSNFWTVRFLKTWSGFSHIPTSYSFAAKLNAQALRLRVLYLSKLDL